MNWHWPWPWRRPTVDPTGVQEARDVLEATEVTGLVVDVIAQEHKRRLEENNLGPKIAAALRLQQRF